MSIEGPKQNKLETTREEIRREARLIKDRLQAILNRLDSASETELSLVNQMVHNASHEFDVMAGTDQWRKALIESAQNK